MTQVGQGPGDAITSLWISGAMDWSQKNHQLLLKTDKYFATSKSAACNSPEKKRVMKNEVSPWSLNSEIIQSEREFSEGAIISERSKTDGKNFWHKIKF